MVTVFVFTKRGAVFLGLTVSCILPAAAADGPLGIDKIVARSDTGIWARSNQRLLQHGSTGLIIGAALWEGSQDRFGLTLWKSVDSMIMADVAAQVGKRVFRRKRPIDGNDPNAWFKAGRNQSFPSGEVTHITAIVTPLIAEYAVDYPAVWLLGALPVYDGIARIKSQAHWQTDVLAGLALGASIGLYNVNRSKSWTVSMMPSGVMIGFKKRF
jgi:membrane-associated phospholipid phosphatase